VDAAGVQFLFGCSSFDGADPQRHGAALALLANRHLAPLRWQPRIKRAGVIPYAHTFRAVAPDPKAAVRAMPPLLRTYLLMGGWVSDHAVPDPDLDTLHVFTGLEIAAIPPARARLLREVAA
jgi:L-ornithine Nalpha-acyltransferase